MTTNITGADGGSLRVMSTYTSGGTADGRRAERAMLFAGNTDGLKDGTSLLLGTAHNDTFIAGASDEIVTGGGNNFIQLKNNRDGGATLDLTSETSARNINNISGYDPIRNCIRITADELSRVTARFEDGDLVTEFGNTSNRFIREQQASGALDEILETPLEAILARDVMIAEADSTADSRNRNFDEAIVNTAIDRKK